LGGLPAATPLLVGLGLDEVSTAAASVPAIKAAIARCDTTACRELLAAALRRRTAAEVEALLREFAAPPGDAPLLVPEAVRLRSHARTREEAIRELVDLPSPGASTTRTESRRRSGRARRRPRPASGSAWRSRTALRKAYAPTRSRRCG
jgi:hypothetical protein